MGSHVDHAARSDLQRVQRRDEDRFAQLNALLPGVMIFVTSMCFNLISDGLRSAMDVRF